MLFSLVGMIYHVSFCFDSNISLSFEQKQIVVSLYKDISVYAIAV